MPTDCKIPSMKPIIDGADKIIKAPINTKSIDVFAVDIASGLSFCFADISLNPVIAKTTVIAIRKTGCKPESIFLANPSKVLEPDSASGLKRPAGSAKTDVSKKFVKLRYNSIMKSVILFL